MAIIDHDDVRQLSQSSQPTLGLINCVSVVLMDGRVREGRILPGYVGDHHNAIRNVMVDAEKM